MIERTIYVAVDLFNRIYAWSAVASIGAHLRRVERRRRFDEAVDRRAR
jgi:hypothetical protein